MAGFSAKYLTIASEPEYKSVGKKNTPLIRLFLLENHNRKIDGEWQTVNTSAHSAVAWGQTATDMVMELSKGKTGNTSDSAPSKKTTSGQTRKGTITLTNKSQFVTTKNTKRIMIKYYSREFLQWLGYRKVWYFPSRHMFMADFCKYEYRPYLPKGVYNADYLKIHDNIHE